MNKNKYLFTLITAILISILWSCVAFADDPIQVGILLDTTSPTAGNMGIDEIGDDGVVRAQVSAISDGEEGSGVSKIKWTITKGSTTVLEIEKQLSTTAIRDIQSFSISEKGTYHIKVVLTDAVGNESNEDLLEQDFYIAKEGSGVVKIDGWHEDESPKMPQVFSATNNASGVTYRYKSKENNTYSTTAPTEAGTYEVEAKFPATGIYEEVIAVSEFIVSSPKELMKLDIIKDTTAPTMSSISIGNLVGNNVVVTANGISDGANSSGVKQVIWKVRNASNEDVFNKTNTFDLEPTSDSVTVPIEDVGRYTVIVELVDAFGNSTANSQHGNYSESKTFSREFTAELLQTSFVYNGGENKPGVLVKDQDIVLQEHVDYELSYSNNKNEGTGTVTITGINRYDDEKTLNFTIGPKTINVIADDISKGYGVPNPTLTFRYSGVVDGENHGQSRIFQGSLATTATTSSQRGDYPITIGTLQLKDYSTFYAHNYKIEFTGATLTVAEGTITATASPYAGTYDKNAHGITVNVTAPTSGYEILYKDEDGNYTLTQSPTRTTVGETEVEYKISATGYADMYGTSSISITAKSIADNNVIKSLSQTSFDYDGSEHRAIVTMTYGGTTLVEGTDFDVTYQNIIDSGTATAVVTGKGNYTSTVNLNYTINKITIRVTPDELSKEYGDNDPQLSASYVIMVPGEIPGHTGAFSREVGESVGQYEITVGDFALADAGEFKAANYNMEFVTGKKFTINARSLGNSAVIGTIPTGSYEYDGQPHNPVPTIKDGNQTLVAGTHYNTTWQNSTNAGTAKVIVSGINDYTGTLEFEYQITKRALLVVPDNVTKLAGTADPVLTYTVQRVVSGQTYKFTGALTRDVGEEFGSYEIRKGELELAENGAFKPGNYTFTVREGSKLTIVGNGIGNITLSQNTYEYNGSAREPIPTVYDSASNVLTKGTHYTVSYEDNKNAGTAKVIITGIGNYSGTTIKEFTISKRNLNIKGDDKQILKGDNIPALTYTVTNLVDGEVPSYTGTLATTATSTSDAGTYPITRGTLTPRSTSTFNASNYNVVYTNGTITVSNKQMDVVYSGYTGMYDGRDHQISIEVRDPLGGYTIKYGTSAGTYNLTTSPTQKEIGTKRVYFEITAPNYAPFRGFADIDIQSEGLYKARIVLGQNQYVYSGQANQPSVTIFMNSTQLVQDTDYTVRYEDNVNVGTARVIITGKGGYSGSRTEEFLIIKKPLTIKPSQNYSKTYQNADPTPFAVTVEGLVTGESYGSTGMIARSEGEDVGKYEINSQGTFTLVASGRFNPDNYDISFLRNDKYLTINRRDISSGTITFNEEYIYNGEPITPIPTLVVNGTVLVADRDYTITYTNNTNQGTARLTLTGIGNYTGTKSANYTIKKANFERLDELMTVEVTPDTYIYDATAHTPATRVTFDGRELVRNTDYTVSYLNNVEVGNNSAIAVVTGIGNYEGRAQQTFTILPRQLEGNYVLSENRYEYDGTPKVPRITSFVAPNGWNVVEGVDYTATYVNNINVGNAKIVLTAMNHYTGTMEIGFEIYKTIPVLTLEDKIVPYSGGIQKINDAAISKIYKYGGDVTESTARASLVYNYYTDADLTNKLNTLPRNVGTYYVQAYLPGDANHEDAYSNVVKLVIFGNPTDPIIKGNDGTVVIPNGGTVKDTIYINIYGSKVNEAEEVLVGYKYSINDSEWANYTDTLVRYIEGKVTVRAYAYVIGEPSMTSNVSTYIVTIDKQPPEAANIVTVEEADSVVVDISINDTRNEIEKIFITEDASHTISDSDEWIDVSGTQGEADKAIFELSQGDEDKTIYVWEKDNAGNIVGPITKTIKLNATKIGNNNINKTNMYFKVTDLYLFTSNIGASDVTLHVNGFNTTGGVTRISREAITDGYKYTAVIENVTGNGELGFNVSNRLIYDKAGNHTAESNQEVDTKEITVDNTIPILRTKVLDNKVQIYAEDDHIKAVMLNGAVLGRQNGDYEAYLAEGKNIVKVIDEYGNDISKEHNYHQEVVETRSQANKPELLSGMKAIKYATNGSYTEVGYFTDDMYSYESRGDNQQNTTSKWANATTPDGSEWVWIPRFAYKANSGGTYDIIFLRERNNDYIDINGNISALPLGYKVAKAFTIAGGARYELRGFWISKYEISKETSSNNGATWVEATTGGSVLTRNAGNSSYIRVVSKANRTPWRSINVSTAFDNSENMYSADNSHLIKNSEYEAALLLGLSEYGRNGNYITLDNTDKTGTANNTSTTGNITGVFDLIGGSFEYTSTFINNGALSANASSLVNSSNHSIKEEITTADLNSIILSNAEKAKFNTSVYNTSYIVYRGLDRQNSSITAPVGGAASDRIGYRVVLSNDGTPVSDGAGGSSSMTITLKPNGASGSDYSRTLTNTTSFTLLADNYYARDGYVLKGWSESATADANTDTYYAPGQTIALQGNTTLYAVWQQLTGTYVDGNNFNMIIKRLAGNSGATQDTEDTNIKAISWQTTEPSNSIKESAANIGLSSEVPIYAWYDNNTIKIWSRAKKLSLNENSEGMFANLKEITSIDLSSAMNTTTKGVSNMTKMFDGCSKLTFVDFNDFNTNNVVTMFSMFRNCSSLNSLNLSGFDTSNVTVMRSMFEKCENLSSVDVSSFNTKKVNDMAYMFQGCKNIQTLNLSNFDTLNVSNMSYMFDTCTRLSSLNVSAFNTHYVTDMSFMFKGCENLTSLNLSSFTTEKVTDMKYMFCLCNKLSTLNMSFDTSSVTDMSYMFDTCSRLTAINLSRFNTAKVTNMQNMFKGCETLASLDASTFNTSKVTNMTYMFCQCKNLTSLNVSSFDTAKVTDMTCMFDNCQKLTSLDITSFNTVNVENMYWMFTNCNKLASIDLSNFNTAKVTNMESMFSNCNQLQKIYTSSMFDTSRVTASENMFLNCNVLKGENGTSYDASKVDKEYARIDALGVERLPGYFSTR